MASKPTEDLHWADVFQTEQHTIDGILRDVPNRESIPSGYGDSGKLFGTPLWDQYLNQAFYLAGAWQRHLNERYSIGDIHFTTSSESAVTISARLGGTWVQRGTQDIGTVVGAKVWEKTA